MKLALKADVIDWTIGWMSEKLIEKQKSPEGVIPPLYWGWLWRCLWNKVFVAAKLVWYSMKEKNQIGGGIKIYKKRELPIHIPGIKDYKLYGKVDSCCWSLAQS